MRALARIETDMRERRCIVTGETLSEAELVRFVVGPEFNIVPDIAAKLPGRGIWLTAKRAAIEKAVSENLFARAAGQAVYADKDLAQRTEDLLASHMLETLGMARRAGALIIGLDKIEATFRSANPPSVVVEAADAGGDGRRKLQSAAMTSARFPLVIGCFSRDELGLAVGLDNVVHAALRPGRFAERLKFDSGRLKGFRSLNLWDPGVQSGSVAHGPGQRAALAKDRNG